MWVVFASTTLVGLAASNERTRAFDVPAGDAATTLLTFATQAAEQVAFPPDAVRGVKTNTVKGDFTPRVALQRMTDGTPLVAVVDEQSGALAVKRSPRPNGQGAAATVHSSRRPGSASIYGRVQNIATGQYLNNARVTVRGTDQVAFTDETGTYRLADLPEGRVELEIFYTNLDTQTVAVDATAGEAIERNVNLTSAARYGGDGGIVALDKFTVAAEKETDAQAIANNEQRFAPNIKNVMSTDSLGDVFGSSVGEFLKFIPGVTATYDNASVIGISIRGIGGAMTSFSADGAPMVSTGVSINRAFDTNSMALNDISRIEVTKVPTPSTPADSLAGSVNMISKSAFERSKAQLRYGVNLVGNGENLYLEKMPRAYDDRDVWKITPGLDFDLTLPINKRFGVILTGLSTDRFNEQHISQMTFNTAGTGTGASISKPYLQSHLAADDPRNEARRTLSFKADWRVTRHSVLSFSAQWNELVHSIGNNRLTPNVGTIATPTVATGVPFSFGDDYTIGATGRGSVTMSMTSQRYEQRSTVAKSNYRFDDGLWKIEAAASRSHSRVVRRATEHGHFHSVDATLITPVRVSFLNIRPDNPDRAQVFDNANQPVDLNNINNYRVTTAVDQPVRRKAIYESANLNVRRRLNLLPVPFAVQGGGAVGIQTVDSRSYTRNWTYAGPDGNIATPDSPAPYLMQSYVNQPTGYGYDDQLPWFSARRAYTAFEQNPSLFVQTPAQLVNQEVARITNSEALQETVTAYYLQAETNLVDNRLKLLTGVRYEKTEDDGRGMLYDPNAVFDRNADGTFAHNATGGRIRRTQAGAAGSMEEVNLTRKERAYEAQRSYDGYYPSVHITFDVKENFLVRLAYAKTYGRPNFTDIIPNATINEADLSEAELADPTLIKGSITVRNTALRPWTAQNYDLSLEYYTRSGGLFSGGVFVKEIDDFFGSAVKLATIEDLESVGLDPRYVGWNLSTKFNAGDARVSGIEFNIRQPLRGFGRWGSYFTLFANATKLKLEGNQQASFTSFIPKSANWGASFSRKRVAVVVRWNYRGLDQLAAVPAFGPDAFGYIQARTTLDLSFAYQISPRLSLNASVNNLFDEPQVALRYGSQTPGYARQFNTRNFGAMVSLGIKGTF